MEKCGKSPVKFSFASGTVEGLYPLLLQPLASAVFGFSTDRQGELLSRKSADHLKRDQLWAGAEALLTVESIGVYIDRKNLYIFARLFFGRAAGEIPDQTG